MQQGDSLASYRLRRRAMLQGALYAVAPKFRGSYP